MSVLKILLDEIMYLKNLSVRQVSIMTGIPKSTVYDIMTGRKIPRIDTMEVIAAGLKIRISDLYESPYK
nr:helix-turn-helix transcriptional regulator [Blautia caecimuris]